MVAILEDDPARIREMQACLIDVLSGVEGVFFEDANEMNVWLEQHLGEVLLISLDHDLPLQNRAGHAVDCGTGRQVADYLASMPPTCPVIVHSSNNDCAAGMFFALKDGGWPVSRVYPVDDLGWVRRDWAAQVSRYIQNGWIVL